MLQISIPHDHGTKANPRTGSAHLEAAFLWHAQLEVETDTWNAANDGDGWLADCL